MFEDISKVILLSDMDGTLLDSHKQITDIDRAAIRRFTGLGGHFSVATGRTIQSFDQYRSMTELKSPVIMYNGAAIHDYVSGETLYTHPLPDNARQLAMDIMAAMPENGGEVLCTDNTYVFSNTDYQKLHTKICGITPVYAGLDEIPEGGWLKVLFAMSPEDMLRMEVLISQMSCPGVDFVRSSDIFWEMLPKGISKGSALEVYRTLPGYEDFTFVAAGDFDNDLEMLRAADLGACPANAEEIVRENADIVLGSTNDEGAVAELIDHIIRRCSEHEEEQNG
ncbi:MAG: HAD family hydrolase [Ruminococcus sp.]|nr:HAD family hydrolase [Ruminococcus sp.]